MTDTLTIILSVAGMVAAATGVTLTVTIAMIRMARTDVGKRIDDLRADVGRRIDDLRAETRDAHAQIGQRIDDTNKRIDDTNARISDLRADFRTLFPRAAAERPDG